MYNLTQWICFFFLYAICGFVWETVYVSIRLKSFQERGFLHGPYLPIYGFGAVIILIATLPVQHNIWLIYLMGMIAATALEYITGVAMEKMFRVRYWDYSYRKLQYKGHICLHSSIGWGFFSILLVKVIHPPIEGFVLHLPLGAIELTIIGLMIIFTADTYVSTREALDLRAALIKLAESNEDIRRIKKRIDVNLAFAEDDWNDFVEEFEQYKEETKSEARKLKDRFKLNMEYAKRKAEDRLDRLQAHVELFFEEVEEEAREQRWLILEDIERKREYLRKKTERDYRGIYNILKRNPTAVSRLHKEELEAILKMLEK